VIAYEEREYVDRMFNQPLQGAFELGKPGQVRLVLVFASNITFLQESCSCSMHVCGSFELGKPGQVR
jgi:hypothetical protein